MKLIPISEHPDHAKILYDLLAERDPSVNISHKKMPTWGEHLAFIASEPYAFWYLVEGPSVVDDDDVEIEPGSILGSVYLTRADEIGVAVFETYRRLPGRFFGRSAVRLLMETHPRKVYYANINPANEPSRKMFEKLGFKKIQETFALEAE